MPVSTPGSLVIEPAAAVRVARLADGRFQFWWADEADRVEIFVLAKPESREMKRLAATAVAQSQPEKAAQLFGTAAAHRAALENPLPPNEKPYHDHLLAAIRNQLGESTFVAAWSEGERMSLATAVQNQRLPHRPN